MAAFTILLTPRAARDLEALGKDKGLAKRLKAARKTLGILEAHGRRHPGLQSHKYSTLRGAHGEDVWESYVEQRTPAAYRIFWHYGPADGEITVLAITPHP